MRFQRLSLIAFGPFTACELDLAEGAPGGLHVVYGANEAGKSTALRAVSGLLFGIPERTPDDHRHPAKDICVGAALEAGDGSSVAVIRRKKRKDSLRNACDEPLAEAVLQKLIGGISEPHYRALFGFDHVRLREGGEALLAGRGDIGESLFDAGSGGSGVHRVLAELRAEAEKLFKPRAQSPQLNAAIEAYKQAHKAQREATLPAQSWLEQKDELERTRQELERLQAERQRLRETQYKKNRVLRILVPVGRRRQCADELAAMPPAPVLADRCPERRQESLALRAQAGRDVQRLESELSQKRARHDAVSADERLAGLDEAIVGELSDAVGAFRKARIDLGRLQSEVQARKAGAEALLKRLGDKVDLERVERLRLARAEQAKIRRLGQQHGLLEHRAALARAELARSERQLAGERAALSTLAEPSDAAALEAALSDARRAGDLEARISETHDELSRLEAQASAELQRLSLGRTPLERVAELDVPGADAVEHAERALSELIGQQERVAEQRREIDDRLAEVERRLERERATGDVPSEEQLMQVRERRDALWRLVERAWRRGEHVDEELGALGVTQALDQAFAATQVQADALADRLRREAQRVREVAALMADQRHCAQEREHLDDIERGVAERRRRFDESWSQLWQSSGVAPAAPRQMRSFVARHIKLTELCATIAERKRTHERLSQTRGEHVARLAAALGVATVEGSSLSALIERAEAQARHVTDHAREAAQYRQRVAVAEADVAEQRREQQAVALDLARWRAAWAPAVQPLGLEAAAEVDEALARLDDLNELFQLFDPLADKRYRIECIERDARQFGERVSALCAVYAADLQGRPADEAARELGRRQQQACERLRERQRLSKEIGEREDALSAARKSLAVAEDELAELCRAAGVSEAQELEHLESLVAARRSAQAQLAAAERELLEVGDGLSLDELLELARGQDRPRVTSELQALEDELAEVEEQLHQLKAKALTLEHGLELGSAPRAAEAAQELGLRASEVREHTERYLRVRLAIWALEREIERYRDQNQGPILARSSELFSRLTLQNYRGLRVGREQPVIVCVRRDGSEIDVVGLSDGTRDQLYLALRLASLERHLETHEPLPLVLDDILIHFDEERARAALEVLGELAARVQILFFTHHRQLVEIAREVMPAQWVRCHILPGPERGTAQVSLGFDVS